MQNDATFMDRALELAERNSRSGRHGPFGAVVVQGGRVIGEGVNQVVEQADPTAHAEVGALRAACRRIGAHVLEQATLYASCEPCPMCLAAIYWARIERVVYACTRQDAAEAGFDDDAIYRDIARPWSERRIRVRQLCRSAGLPTLVRWKNHPAPRSY